MTRSLRRQLTRTLAVAILFSGLLATAVSFGLAYLEAKEFQDDMLEQIAALDPESSPTLDALSVAADDAEYRIIVLHMPQDPRPDWLPRDLPSGLHTLNSKIGRLRTYVSEIRDGQKTVVIQPTEERDEIAIYSALRTLVPLMLLLPVLSYLTVRIVRRELKPIARLSGTLDAQSADRPQPLVGVEAPDEIMPFILAINRLFHRVDQLIRHQRRFIADAAHELRSPLTALSIQAENVRQATSIDDMRRRLIPLSAGIERAQRLTEQLLNLAAARVGPDETVRIDLSDLSRELIAELLSRAEEKSIDLGLEALRPVCVRAAPQTLRVVLKNALENAIKYTPENGTVTVRIDARDGRAIVEVIDSGPGIPEAERERVFNAFYRIPGSVGEGSGLGLAIAREAAERLGGTVSIHRGPNGSGTVFRYRHPNMEPNHPTT